MKFCLIRLTKRNGTVCREILSIKPEMTAGEASEIYCREFLKAYGYIPSHAFQAHEGDWVSALIAVDKL